jgi:outer membrane protein OmpA-like peptidoglycan-associated protein
MVQKNYFSKIFKLFLILFLFGMVSANAQSVFKDFGWKGGLRLNGVLPVDEFSDDNGLALKSFLVDAYLRYELSRDFNLELNAGYGQLKGDDYNYNPLSAGTGEYKTSIIPIELRLLYTPFELEDWNPYFYAGFGALHYSVDTKPNAKSLLAVEESGWTGVIPVGIGTEIRLSDQIFLDLTAGVNYSLTDNLNYYKIDEMNDGYINVGLGLTFSNESLNTDKDGDGLLKKQELQLGTDPNNPDTDGDGLKDGEEVKTYKTNPLKADTDGDGLNDGEEVMKYKTDPLNVDTDGDGLVDGDEVLKIKTDPLNADTDGDGLKDGEEVLKYKTDPLKADTDGDGLKDGEEVLKYKTDPLKVDTDGGTIGDGVEVKRGTNPLDPKDDIPVTTVEKEYNLDMVHFAFNKFNLSKDAKKILDSDYETITKYTEPKITLSGHADFIGSDDYNMKLSEKRANTVKDYLVKKGLDEKIISVQAFGESKPLDPAKTAKARAMNRRTEVTAKVMEKAN